MMARVVGERFGGMSKEDVKAVMGKEGEGAEGGKHLKQEGSRLVIKSKPGGGNRENSSVCNCPV